MHVQTKHHPLPEALQTWSPYRAADQVALISMPNSMVRIYFTDVADFRTYEGPDELELFFFGGGGEGFSLKFSSTFDLVNSG